MIIVYQERKNKRVELYLKLTELATGFKNLRGATIAKDGSIYLTDYGVSALYRLKKR